MSNSARQFGLGFDGVIWRLYEICGEEVFTVNSWSRLESQWWFPVDETRFSQSNLDYSDDYINTFLRFESFSIVEAHHRATVYLRMLL